jgi:glutamate--cysteine ligase
MHLSQFLSEQMARLQAAPWKNTIKGIRRGIERETLRIKPDGGLSQQDHPHDLGSALTHPLITTDFSESLLEFITPAQSDINTTIAQLTDIHRFAMRQLGEERLGSGSMPCFIEHQDEIRLAYYGTSNVGRMKTLYRKGLKNRYGSMMQAISGVHFNFSLPEAFWQGYQQSLGNTESLQDFISAQYLGLIRNYKRYVWLIVYLFGASPAMCKSFLQGRQSKYPFQNLGKGSLYLPYATSLRMSDLGYTNSAQSALNVSYNNLPDYIKGLQQAISTPSAEYQSIGVKVDGEYQQLNANILQIENEFYSTIRPKRTTQSGERPTCALAKRGVEYIEVRALDVNPFSAVGITAEQMRFLDLFLLYCLLEQSPLMSAEEQNRVDNNLRKVVTDGRRINLELLDGEHPRLMQDWAEEIFAALMPLAHCFDEVHGGDNYQAVLKQFYLSLLDPAQTYSGKVLNQLIAAQQDNSSVSLSLSETYRQQLLKGDYQFYSEAEFLQMAKTSLSEQSAIEQKDSISFDDYLKQYFIEDPAKLCEAEKTQSE